MTKGLLCDHMKATLSLFIRNFQIEYQNVNSLKRKDLMLSFLGDEMTLDQINYQLSLFMRHSIIAYKTEKLL